MAIPAKAVEALGVGWASRPRHLEWNIRDEHVDEDQPDIVSVYVVMFQRDSAFYWVAGKEVLVVVEIHGTAQHYLLDAVDAGDGPGTVACLAQRRQEHGGEDCDDGDHHEKFNQGERLHLPGIVLNLHFELPLLFVVAWGANSIQVFMLCKKNSAWPRREGAWFRRVNDVVMCILSQSLYAFQP